MVAPSHTRVWPLRLASPPIPKYVISSPGDVACVCALPSTSRGTKPVLAALVLSMVLCSCGQSPPNPERAPSPSHAVEPVVVHSTLEVSGELEELLEEDSPTEEVRADLEGKTAAERLAGIDQLVARGSVGVAERASLEALLNDPAGSVRVGAAVAYARATGETSSSAGTLVQILRCGTPYLQISAAHAIRDLGLGSPEVIEALVQTVEGTIKCEGEKIYAESKAERGNVYVEPIFIGWTPAGASADALGAVADAEKRVVAALEALSGSSDSFEQECAIEALAELTARERKRRGD